MRDLKYLTPSSDYLCHKCYNIFKETYTRPDEPISSSNNKKPLETLDEEENISDKLI